MINYTDLPDGHHVGVISSQSWVLCESYCTGLVSKVQLLLCNVIPFLWGSKRSASLCLGFLASLVWRLCRPLHSAMGTMWMTVFLGWVCSVVFTHTQLLKEMSAELYRRWWQTLWRVSANKRQRDKWSLQGRTLNSFLFFCSSINISWIFSHDFENLLDNTKL